MLALVEARTSEHPSSRNSKNLFSSTLVREILIRFVLAGSEEALLQGDVKT